MPRGHYLKELIVCVPDIFNSVAFLSPDDLACYLSSRHEIQEDYVENAFGNQK